MKEDEDGEDVEKEKEEENPVSSRNSTLKDQSRFGALERAFREILQATETDSRKKEKRNGRKHRRRSQRWNQHARLESSQLLASSTHATTSHPYQDHQKRKR